MIALTILMGVSQPAFADDDEREGRRGWTNSVFGRWGKIVAIYDRLEWASDRKRERNQREGEKSETERLREENERPKHEKEREEEKERFKECRQCRFRPAEVQEQSTNRLETNSVENQRLDYRPENP